MQHFLWMIFIFINWLYMFRTITSPSSGASSHKLYNALVCVVLSGEPSCCVDVHPTQMWLSSFPFQRTFCFEFSMSSSFRVSAWRPDTWKLFVILLSSSSQTPSLTLNLLTWRIWWFPTHAGKCQVGFNSAFKGLINEIVRASSLSLF